MDDISERLSAILNDPEGMEKIKKMAENMLGPKEEKVSEPLEEMGLDMASLTRAIGLLKNKNKENDRVKLLLALKPHLSLEKRERVDVAVKILKLLDMAPLLKEMGIFNI
jgi:hypothetical protein